MRTLRFAAVALAAVALTGCAAAAAGPSTPSPTAVVTETPTPAPEPVAAEIVVSGVGFTLVDTAGETVFTHAWADEVAPAVAALTGAFQSEPTMSLRDGSGGHFADFDLYTWGAFTLGDAVDLEKPRADYFLPSLVEVTEPEVAGITVVTSSGFAVGSTVAAVSEVEPLVREARDADDYFEYRVDPEDPALVPPAPGGETTDMVGLQADATDTTITLLKAPVLSYYPF
ncbi:hypothetical protein LQ757_10630 [Agromyces sp. SYSU K20354]|uniref:hypothetical protein n=1 Tax=Agromyces cavernae TaxID=2898659 RepID=UPI001E5A9229|nr:hypothetical protein [Agromyces cavernae]MCD2442728.1 hypothetical protein [Agromyces cavernae]